MHKRYRIVIFLCCIGIGAFLLFIHWVFLAQQQLSYYDGDSYRQSGLKALLSLLRRENYQMTVTGQGPRELSHPLILLSTGKIPLPERARLLRWVKSGGTILELTSGSPGIYPEKGPLAKNPRYHFTFIPADSDFGAAFDLAAAIRYRPKSNLLVTQSNPDQGYFRYQGNYFCYRTFYGKGSIISWNDLDGLTNLHLKENPDNAVAFVLLLSHLALGHRLSVLNLTQAAFQLPRAADPVSFFDRYGGVILLLLLGAALVLWKITVRFGRPQPLTIATGRSYQEFLSSMAYLFQRAGARQMVLTNLWRSLWRVMIEITFLPADSGIDRVIAKLAAVTGKDYAALQGIYRQLQSGPGGPGPFWETARQLDDYRRELKQWKISRTW